jgi:hypothetical protein
VGDRGLQTNVDSWPRWFSLPLNNPTAEPALLTPGDGELTDAQVSPTAGALYFTSRGRRRSAPHGASRSRVDSRSRSRRTADQALAIGLGQERRRVPVRPAAPVTRALRGDRRSGAGDRRAPPQFPAAKRRADERRSPRPTA